MAYIKNKRIAANLHLNTHRETNGEEKRGEGEGLLWLRRVCSKCPGQLTNETCEVRSSPHLGQNNLRSKISLCLYSNRQLNTKIKHNTKSSIPVLMLLYPLMKISFRKLHNNMTLINGSKLNHILMPEQPAKRLPTQHTAWWEMLQCRTLI